MPNYYNILTCQEAESQKLTHTLSKSTGVKSFVKNATNHLRWVILYTLPSQKEIANTTTKNVGIKYFSKLKLSLYNKKTWK